MHWILYSVKFENRNGWNAGETDADTAQWARLFRPGLADEMNLDLSWGWGASSRARKSCTAHSFHPRFSVRVRCLFRDIICHRTVSLITFSQLRLSDNLSSLCAPYRNKEPFPGFSFSLTIPSPHWQTATAPTESCISKISKRQQNSFSSWDKTWSPNNKYWFKD